jgi:hypothetical protein
MKLKLAIATVALTAALVACGGDPGLGDTPTLKGKATNYSAGAADLYGILGPSVPIKVGSIQSDGTFSLTLPGKDALTLMPFITDNSPCKDIKATPTNLKAALVADFSVQKTATGASLGILAQSNNNPRTVGNLTQVGYIYFDQAGSVKGTCTQAGGVASKDLVQKIDLSFKAGWTAILLKGTTTSTTVTAEFTTLVGNPPSDVKWQFFNPPSSLAATPLATPFNLFQP